MEYFWPDHRETRPPKDKNGDGDTDDPGETFRSIIRVVMGVIVVKVIGMSIGGSNNLGKAEKVRLKKTSQLRLIQTLILPLLKEGEGSRHPLQEHRRLHRLAHQATCLMAYRHNSKNLRATNSRGSPMRSYQTRLWCRCLILMTNLCREWKFFLRCLRRVMVACLP